MMENVIYFSSGLKAVVVDGEAVALYIEDTFRCEITLQEWNNINMALEGVKNG